MLSAFKDFLTAIGPVKTCIGLGVFILIMLALGELLIRYVNATRRKAKQQVDAEKVQRHESYIQQQVNSQFVEARLRELFDHLVPLYTKTLPPSKFDANETIRIDCSPSHFRYGWECLGDHVFTVGKDEEAVITEVFVNSSFLHELVHTRFPDWCDKTNRSLTPFNTFKSPPFGPNINPQLLAAFEAYMKDRDYAGPFGQKNPLYYGYRVRFTDPQKPREMTIAEPFLAHPLPLFAS